MIKIRITTEYELEGYNKRKKLDRDLAIENSSYLFRQLNIHQQLKKSEYLHRPVEDKKMQAALMEALEYDNGVTEQMIKNAKFEIIS